MTQSNSFKQHNVTVSGMNKTLAFVSLKEVERKRILHINIVWFEKIHLELSTKFKKTFLCFNIANLQRFKQHITLFDTKL